MSASGADLHPVVPVYNEAENFPRFHESVRAHVSTPLDITVAYDRVDDPTIPVVRDIEAMEESNFKLLKWLPRYVLWYAYAFRHPRAS